MGACKRVIQKILLRIDIKNTIVQCPSTIAHLSSLFSLPLPSPTTSHTPTHTLIDPPSTFLSITVYHSLPPTPLSPSSSPFNSPYPSIPLIPTPSSKANSIPMLLIPHPRLPGPPSLPLSMSPPFLRPKLGNPHQSAVPIKMHFENSSCS